MRSTIGASTKLRRMARTIGMKTSRPTYNAAITTTPTARVTRLLVLGVSAGEMGFRKEVSRSLEAGPRLDISFLKRRETTLSFHRS
jgi:hypothetical protein